MKVTIEFEPSDELTELGLKFLAGRLGQTLEEYALDSILCSARSDEEGGCAEHFGQLEDELHRIRKLKEAEEAAQEEQQALPE